MGWTERGSTTTINSPRTIKVKGILFFSKQGPQVVCPYEKRSYAFIYCNIPLDISGDVIQNTTNRGCSLPLPRFKSILSLFNDCVAVVEY